jgi:hypothetical protein
MRNKKHHYWLKHMIVLSLGVIAAFYVGMKLGEIKGYIMAGYGMMPMRHQGWVMDGAVRGSAPTVQQVQQ